MRATVKTPVFAILTAVWLAAAALWSVPAAAAEFPYNLTVGESRKGAAKKWNRAAGATAQLLPSEKPQAYRVGLVQSGLLVMLNRAGARHKLLTPGGKGVEFVVVAQEGKTTTLGFVKNRLVALLVRTRVGPDTRVDGNQNPFSKRRLEPIENHLKIVKKRCRLTPRDKGKNHFVFGGKCGRTKAYVEYRPEADEFAELYHL